MISNSMQQSKFLDFRGTTYFHENLSCIVTIKLLGFSTPRESLNPRHEKWVEFLQSYIFVLKHRADVDNRAADVLSRKIDILLTVVIDKDRTANALRQRVDFLLTANVKIIGFKKLKEDYDDCPNFEKIMSSL